MRSGALAQHGINAYGELIRIGEVKDACEGMPKRGEKYRFMIDWASLQRRVLGKS